MTVTSSIINSWWLLVGANIAVQLIAQLIVYGTNNIGNIRTTKTTKTTGRRERRR